VKETSEAKQCKARMICFMNEIFQTQLQAAEEKLILKSISRRIVFLKLKFELHFNA